MPLDHSIFSTKYQRSVLGMIKFELLSSFGRTFLNKKPHLKEKDNLLHMGCGDKIFKNWINADFFTGFLFWKKYKNTPDWALDLRYPLNCADNVFDGIFCEHTMEHLYPPEAMNLIKESYRTLKPGGWIRIGVPDLKKYIEYYTGSICHNEFSSRWKNGCEAIRSLTQNWLHNSVWDSNLLERFLTQEKFSNIKEVKFLQGSDKRLLKDTEERKWETLYIEAQKPSQI